MDPATEGERPVTDGDDGEVLDIELEDAAPEPLPPAEPSSPAVLDVTLDDLDEEPGDYPAVSEFPALTSEQMNAAKPGVTVPCVCATTREHFEVRFQEGEPGVFWAAEVAKTAVKDAKGGGDGAMGSAQGSFRMGPDYRCPHCSDGALTICEACQTVLCLGATDKSGDCPCPACGAILSPTGGVATAAPTRGGKGKKGKGP